MFPAVLFLVLLVYLSSNALEARKLIYGVAIANIGLLPVQLLIAHHVNSAIVINPYHVVPQFFTSQARIVAASSIVLFLDTVFVCIAYEIVSRFTPWLMVRIFLSLLATLCFDSVVFVTGAFAGSPDYVNILVSQLVGKCFSALVYSIVLATYLEYVGPTERAVASDAMELGTMFRIFTYRQRYEELQKRVVRDPLTNVYNRGFFDEAIEKYVEMARHSGRPLCMMMIDVDNFKRVNDAYGHLEGDRVLQLVANALVATLRISDYVCRYGGDEFAVLLPQTELRQAVELAQQMIRAVSDSCADGDGGQAHDVTITVGVAAFPGDARTARELVSVADQRLYAGKAAGRNRVSATVASA
jgi:diguanylate cyclase (GGDEF)-like protein